MVGGLGLGSLLCPQMPERSIVGLLENTTPHRAHHECVQCVGCHVYKYTSYLNKEMAGQRPLEMAEFI